MKRVMLIAAVACLVLNNSLSAGEVRPQTHPYVVIPAKHFTPRASMSWTVANLCKAYSFPTNLTGDGVIGILEFGGGWRQSDLDKFSSLNGLPKITVTNVSIDGTQNNPGVDPNADAEVALDIQAAAASYYYCTGKMPTIKVFFSGGDFVNTFKAAVSANCSVLSISWGASESAWVSQAPGYAQSVESAAQSAAASGLVILAASGDNSSSDGTSGTNVDLPSACPHIIACGGTSKTTATEVVWGDGVATDWGTGGGFSRVFPIQSFQVGAPKAPAGLGRMVPDIAAVADPFTGVNVVVGGQVMQIGGTSFVSPFYSGLFAASGSKLGFVTPLLWQNKAAFTDISQGSNGAYSAAAGPDPCTGLGAPNGTGIAKLFAVSNIVKVNYNTSTKTLTLTGDANANTLSVALSGATVTLQAKSPTLLTFSTNTGAAGSPAASATITSVSGNLVVTGSLADGNDSISLTGLAISTLTLGLGAGNDSASLSYCTIGASTIDGGAGTDVLTTVSTKITTNKNANFP